jgi:hypothetical protein
LHNVAGMKIGPGRSAKRRLALFGTLACLASGCATIDNGNYGVPVDAANRPQTEAAPPPLLVSAAEAPTYSSRYLGLVEVTFENRTSVWKQVDRVAVSFGSPSKNQNVTIASGEDIAAWERAITIGRAIALTNAGSGIEALGRVPVDRLGAWVDQHHPAAAAAGADAPAAAGAQASAVPTPPSYPDQHLLTTPFRVPPGMFTKRWILLSTSDNPRGGCIDSMVLSYETSDHATGRLILSFKVGGTDWQPTACRAPDNPDRRM